MRKSVFFAIVIIFVMIGIWGGLIFVKSIKPTNINSQSVQPVAQIPKLSPSPAPQQAAEFLPQTLIIPKLGINTFVESVGQDTQGRMDVPKEVNNVAWYSLGYKPGEKGNAVLAGHLDTITGAPAVFFNIDKLTAGDEVFITDKTGKNLIFEVTNIQSYPFDQVPLQEIFSSSNIPKLNLITCTGTWDQGARNYSNRLVVYTQIKSSVRNT